MEHQQKIISQSSEQHQAIFYGLLTNFEQTSEETLYEKQRRNSYFPTSSSVPFSSLYSNFNLINLLAGFVYSGNYDTGRGEANW